MSRFVNDTVGVSSGDQQGRLHYPLARNAFDGMSHMPLAKYVPLGFANNAGVIPVSHEHLLSELLQQQGCKPTTRTGSTRVYHSKCQIT